MVTGYTKAEEDLLFGASLAHPSNPIVRFSTLSGASDDAKLASFISSASAGINGLHGRLLYFDEMRNYTFTQQHTIYSGFAIAGPPRAVDQVRSSNPFGFKITLTISGGTGGGGWLVLPNGNTFGVSMSNISFDGNSTSRVFDRNPSAILWTSTFHNISGCNLAGFFGTSSGNQPQDANCFSGFMNWNNIRDTFINSGGSDSRWSPSMLLLDSLPGSMPVSNFLAYISSSNTHNLENWFITAEQHSALSFTGGTAGIPTRVTNMDVQGRNASQPCYGALIRSTSSLIISNCEFAFAMSNPSATGRNDGGVLHFAAGASSRAIVNNVSYNLATGVDASVPFAYVEAGAYLDISHVMAPGFTPTVYVESGATVINDTTVTRTGPGA